jgi:hypothetical protein
MPSTRASKSEVRSRGPVRISLPASVAFNADALKKTIASVVERIGCRTCFSGADCHFSLERNLIVDQHGAINADPVPSPWLIATGPQPLPWNVVVGFQGNVAFNIEQVYKAVDNVISSLGPCPCHSGFDVSYLNELTIIGINQNLQAQRYGEQLSA